MAEDAIPERIWLQWTGRSYGSSWCEERINAADPEYIRADLVERAAPREPGEDMVRLTDVLARIAEASLRYGGTQESWLVGPRQLTEDIRALAARPDAGDGRET